MSSSSALKYESVTIASGGTTSGVYSLKGKTIVGLITPSALTGTAFTFTSSTEEAGTFTTLYQSGANYSVTVAASKHVMLNPQDFAGVDFIKIVSGSAEGADRVITIISREIA